VLPSVAQMVHIFGQGLPARWVSGCSKATLTASTEPEHRLSPQVDRVKDPDFRVIYSPVCERTLTLSCKHVQSGLLVAEALYRKAVNDHCELSSLCFFLFAGS